MELTINFWEFTLGLISIISFVINILQYQKKKSLQNQAKGIYNQLNEIVSDIDRERLVNVKDCKIIINQVRIQMITFNKSLGTLPEIIKPYDFFDKNNFETKITLEKEIFNKRAELENLQAGKNG